MKNKFILLLLFCISSPYLVYGQKAYQDSLRQVISISGIKTDAYYDLINSYRINDDFITGLKVANDYLDDAKKQNSVLDQVKAYSSMAYIYANQSDFANTRKFTDLATNAAAKTESKVAKAYGNLAEAVMYYNFNDTKKVFQYSTEAIKNLGDNSSEYGLLSKVNYFLYSVFTNWNDEKRTKEYANKALEYALKSKDYNTVCSVYTALAVVYTFSYGNSKSKGDLDKIFEYSDLAIQQFKLHPNRVSKLNYSMALQNKASYLIDYNFLPAARAEVVSLLDETMKIAANVKDSHITIASCYGMFAQLAREEHNPAAEEENLQKAYQVISSKQPIYYYTLTSVLRDLSSFYERNGDTKQALEYNKKLLEANAKLFDEDQAETAKRMDAQYQAEKKDQEMKVLQDKEASQRLQKILLFALFIAVVAGAFFMFRSYHFKLRYSLRNEEKLKAEKDETELKLQLEEQEKARLKAEQELLTLKQQRLQDEVLISQLQLDHKNEVLSNIKDKISDEGSQNLKKIIKEEGLLDNDFEKTKSNIQNVHPNFFNVLNQLAKQKLTPLDQKYCAYIYLGMDTKQIASLLNVEAKSVRMSKYRLKQKLALEKEQDLGVFLQSIV